MTHDYLASWIRGKIDVLTDLLEHLEHNDIDNECIKEYFKEIKNSFNRKIKKL